MKKHSIDLDSVSGDSNHFSELFYSPQYRDRLAKARYEKLKNIRDLKKTGSAQTTANVLAHNADESRMFFDGLSQRPDLISKPLSCVNAVRNNAHKMKVLCVGARTEAEIFSIMNAGFLIQNIHAIDLFSYTPYIELMDVCDLKFRDDEFDVVLVGWVLEFCTDLQAVVREITRVAKSGAYICIGGMHSPTSTDWTSYNKRKRHLDRIWYCSISGIRSLFEGFIGNEIFISDIECGDMDKRGDVVYIFKMA